MKSRFLAAGSVRFAASGFAGLVAACLLAAMPAYGTPVDPPLPTVIFSQLDIDFDGDKHEHSEWGAVDLHFLGSAQLLYFNLTVQSGNSGSAVWRIQNLPVLSREGENVEQTTTFYFHLANTPGRKVQDLQYAFALTTVALTSMPLPLIEEKSISNRKYELFTGYGGIPITFAPPPEFLSAAAPVPGNGCRHPGFPNPDVGKSEGVPAATSNSLNWMNGRYSLGIPPELITLGGDEGGDGLGCESPGLRRRLAREESGVSAGERRSRSQRNVRPLRDPVCLSKPFAQVAMSSWHRQPHGCGHRGSRS